MVSLETKLTFNLGQLGKDWNADTSREEAFKAWNVQFTAQPKESVVSVILASPKISNSVLFSSNKKDFYPGFTLESYFKLTQLIS